MIFPELSFAGSVAYGMLLSEMLGLQAQGIAFHGQLCSQGMSENSGRRAIRAELTFKLA